MAWSSTKQKTMVASTMEAEYVACYLASSQAIWLRNLIADLRVMNSIQRPLRMFCDNYTAVKFSNSNKSSSACKHMDIKFLIVKERIRYHLVSIEHIKTDDMLVDPLTKAMSPGTYREHVLNMGLVSSFEVLL